jgi:hypothetical protein
MFMIDVVFIWDSGAAALRFTSGTADSPDTSTRL